MADNFKLGLWLIVANLAVNALPAYTADNTFKGSAGNVFMEETFSTPQIEQNATKALYGAYASVYHHHYDAADKWIKYGRCKAPGEILQAREDSEYLLSVLNKEASKQKHAQVKDSSFEFQVFNALMKQNLGESEIALQSLKDLLVKYPNHAAIEFLKARIKALEYELALEPWDTSPDVVRIGGKKNAFGKWKMSKFPLKVFISTESESLKVKGYKTGDNQLFRSSFETWQKLSGGKVKFVFESARRNADIVCDWVSDPKDLKLPDAIGVCSTYCNSDDSIQKAEIKILTFSDVYYRQDLRFRNETLSECCLHEIGHSLGLKHSTGENDVMTYHAHSKPLLAPTMRDLGALKTQYFTSLNDTLSNAIDLIDNGSFNKAEVLIDKLIAQKANDVQLREAVCICLRNIANSQIKTSDYQSAIKRLLKAKALLKGDESRRVAESVLQTLTLAYFKSGKVKEAELLEKQTEVLCHDADRQYDKLDRLGIKREAIPHFEKALERDPKDEKLIARFQFLLLSLAKMELDNKNEICAYALINKAEDLKGTNYGTNNELYDMITPAIKMAKLVKAAAEDHPQQWLNSDAQKAQIDKINTTCELYEKALRRCAVLYQLKNEFTWASTFIVRTRKYDVPGAKEPFSTLYSLRHKLIELTNEDAVLSFEAGLSPN